MAEIETFPEVNFMLTAPRDRDDVRDLPCHRHDGGLISCWRLSQEEIAEIARTGVVWLHVMTPNTHPPVYIGGERPFQTAECDA